MSNWLRLVLLLSVLILNACSSSTYLKKKADWWVSNSELDIQVWGFRGRMLIRSDEVLNANIRWQHNGTVDELSLYGVWGLDKRKIEIDGKKISLDSGKDRKLISNDVDGFIAQQLGFIVPLTALRRWVLGRPIKNKSVIEIENGFEQLGWKIKSSRFKKTEIGVMPHKLEISKNEIKLILIIDRWER
jgi:outer membrane lipoprotein LolB